jgi:hypothetical protein
MFLHRGFGLKKYNDYLPEFLGILLALLILNLWYLSSLAIDNKIIPSNLDYLYRGVTVLIGAFIGALSAFKLNSKKDEDKKHTEQKMAMNKAIFVNIRQINAIKVMDKELSKYKSDLDKAFQLPALKPPCYKDLKYNFDDLGFLFEEHPQLMMNLAIEQERFEQVFKSIDIRNDFYITEVQPALSALKLNGKSVLAIDIPTILGERLFEGSINSARAIYSHIERSNKTLIEIHDEMAGISRKVFPGEKLVRWKAET